MDKKEYRKRVEKAKKHVVRLQKRITTADASNQPSQVRFHMNRLMSSMDAKLVATVKANSKLPKGRRINTPEELIEIAAEIDAWKGTTERARIRLQAREEKPDEPRAVIAFGIRQKALQYLVSLAFKPLAKRSLKPYQFSQEGGVRKAVETVLQKLHEGYGYLLEIDIASCYTSYNEEALTGLLILPVKVAENVVIGRDLPFVVHHIGLSLGNGDDLLDGVGFREAIAEVQHGIPQGSALSPIISDVLLSMIDIDCPESVCLVVFADNFLILGKDEETVCEVALNLAAAIHSHPAGPLTPRVEQTGKVENGFDFLGYHFYPLGNGYAVRPSDRNRYKFDYRYREDLEKIPLPHLATRKHLKKVKKLENWVKGWCAAFSLWDGMKEFRTERLTHLKALRIEISNELSSTDKAA